MNNIENMDIYKGFIYYHNFTHIDVLAWLAHFMRNASTFWKRMIQRLLLRGRGTSIAIIWDDFYNKDKFCLLPMNNIYMLYCNYVESGKK